MASQKSAGIDVILIILAILILIVALSGNASTFLKNLLAWLMQNPVAKTTSSSSTGTSSGTGTKTVPAAQPAAATNPLLNLWPFGGLPGKTIKQPAKQPTKQGTTTTLPIGESQLWPQSGGAFAVPAAGQSFSQVFQGALSGLEAAAP